MTASESGKCQICGQRRKLNPHGATYRERTQHGGRLYWSSGTPVINHHIHQGSHCNGGLYPPYEDDRDVIAQHIKALPKDMADEIAAVKARYERETERLQYRFNVWHPGYSTGTVTRVPTFRESQRTFFNFQRLKTDPTYIKADLAFDRFAGPEFRELRTIFDDNNWNGRLYVVVDDLRLLKTDVVESIHFTHIGDALTMKLLCGEWLES